jgi:hypothetical protein
MNGIGLRLRRPSNAQSDEGRARDNAKQPHKILLAADDRVPPGTNRPTLEEKRSSFVSGFI